MKASVLLITYNHAPYVAQAIESALAQQAGFAFEILIGDDCSTDGTRQIVCDFRRRHPERIRTILPERNLGGGGNPLFLQLLAGCRGEVVAFLDGDDYWISPDKLLRQAAFLDAHTECSMCFHNVRVLHEGDRCEPRLANPPDQKEVSTLADLLRGNFIETCSAMVRRGPFRELPDWLAGVSPLDWAIYLLAAQQGDVGYLHETMGVYRRHENAVWHGHDRAFYLESAVAFYETVGRHLGPAWDDIVKEERSRRCYDLSRLREGEGDRRAAAAWLVKAVEGRPEWMEGHLPGVGEKGPAVWRLLGRKLRHPAWPAVGRLLGLIQPATEAVGLAVSRLNRRLREGRRGFLAAHPNPALARAGRRHGSTTLSWVSSGTDAIEVRVGAPDGRLLSSSGTAGSETASDWVSDGMCFYLQDVSDGKPLTLAHTLDRVRVRVVSGDDDARMPTAVGPLRARRTGTIAARPNPIAVQGGTAIGSTTLEWTATGAGDVEVRVGAPRGPLLARSGPAGGAQSVPWVQDGMVFFLQEVSDLPRIHAGKTLATVTVRLR